MNLKKILSGFLAAAMAVTTMVTANAEPAADGSTTVTVYEFDSSTVGVFSSYEITSLKSQTSAAQSKVTITLTGTPDSSAEYWQFYARTASWSANTSTNGVLVDGVATLEITSADTAVPNWQGTEQNDWATITSSDGLVLELQNIAKVTEITVSVDGGEAVTVFDAATAIGVPCGAGYNFDVPVSDLTTYGITSDNIDTCKVKVTVAAGSGGEAKLVSIPTEYEWEQFAYYADISQPFAIATTEGESFTNEIALTKGLRINISNVTVSKIELIIPAATTEYDIDITTPTNGTVAVTNTGGTTVTKAAENDVITVTAAPAEGYVLDKITVTDESDSAVAVTMDTTNTNKGTFTMPGKAVTVTATFKTAEVALTGITLNKTTATIAVGGTTTLTASKVPSTTTDETPITWSSNKENIATVTAGGVVTGVAAGTAVITATCGEKTATCTVTVSENAIECTGITLNKTTATVEKNATVTLTATTTPADTTDDITWASSDTSIATVEDGVVTGKARGTADITVTCGTKSATCKVSVTEDKTVTAPVTAGGAEKSYSVVTTAADGTKVKTVDTVYAITEADLQCKGYTVTITNTSNGKSITREITNAYKSVTVKSAEDLGNDTFTGYFLVVRVKNVPENVTLSYKFDKIS